MQTGARGNGHDRRRAGGRGCSRGTGALLALLVCLLGAPAFADTLELDIRLSPDQGLVEGEATWRMSNTTDGPLEAVSFWLYGNRFAAPPERLNGLTWFRVYPGGFDAGTTTITRVVIDDESRPLPETDGAPTVATLALPTPLAPGAETTLRLGFRTRIPARYGPYGVVGDAVTLEGGFYPTPVFLGAEGPRRDVPPAASRAIVRLRVDVPGQALVGGIHRRVGPDTETRPVRLAPVRSVSLAFRPAMERLHASAEGVNVELLIPPGCLVDRRRQAVRGASLRARRGSSMRAQLAEPGSLDRSAPVLGTVRDGLSHVAAVAPALLPRHVRMVETPLRRHLALPGAGVVWVSDRLMRLTPFERLRKFHRLALLRGVFAALAREYADGREAPGDRDWVAEVVAEHLLRSYVASRYGEDEDAFDVLAPGAFLAVVDDVLYAPQMPFMTAFFSVVDDSDPLRDRYRFFFDGAPSGRRLYAKLLDRLGPEGVTALLGAYLSPPGRALRELPSAPDEPFFRQWLGDYPWYDVRLGAVRTRPRGDGFDHEVELVRTGGALPREPVTVRLLLEDGTWVDATWEGEEPSGTVTVSSRSPLDAVWIDPQGRLVQRLPGVPDDLRLNDRSFSDVKVLLGQLFLAVSPTAGELSAMAEVSFQRRYDLRHRFGILPFVVPGRLGAAIVYRYAFGPRITANRLGAFLRTSLRGAAVETDTNSRRYEPGFVVQMALGYDDAVSPLDMLRRNFGAVVARYFTGGRDGAVLHGGQAELLGSQVWAPHARHRLAVRMSAGTTVGDLLPGERFTLGGLEGVRAVTRDEFRGRHIAVAGFEYRHTFTRSLSTELTHLLWWEGIEGVLFVDAGVTAASWGELFTAESAAAGVGYGLRLHGSLFGVQPALLALDFAYALPITARLRSRTGPPLAVHVHFTQTF